MQIERDMDDLWFSLSESEKDATIPDLLTAPYYVDPRNMGVWRKCSVLAPYYGDF